MEVTPSKEANFVALGPVLKSDAPPEHYLSHMNIDPTLSRHDDAEMRLLSRVHEYE